jgi:uncharacterized protein (DUF58 family)
LTQAAATHRRTRAQAETLAAAMPRLLLAAERLAFVAAPGRHGRRRGGPGDAFWQYRDWQDGDEVRRIDWRRSARGERLFLREREWDVPATIGLVLEDTPSLDFHSARNFPTKREAAILLLLALAAILLRAGERVALPGRTPPLTGGHAIESLATALLSDATQAAPAPARTVRFGDFLQAPAFTGAPGGAVMQILDPAECDFTYHGHIRFEGFAGEAPLDALDAAAWATAYRRRIEAHRAAVATAAMQAGQTPLFHRTDHPPAAALAALHQALARA